MRMVANALPGVDVAEAGEGPVAADPPIAQASGTSVTVKRAEIGFDVGYSFFSGRCGSNSATVTTTIEAWMNEQIHPVFISGPLIEHVVGTIMIRTVSGATDPYNGMSDANTILPKFRDIWNGGRAAAHPYGEIVRTGVRGDSVLDWVVGHRRSELQFQLGQWLLLDWHGRLPAFDQCRHLLHLDRCRRRCAAECECRAARRTVCAEPEHRHTCRAALDVRLLGQRSY